MQGEGVGHSMSLRGFPLFTPPSSHPFLSHPHEVYSLDKNGRSEHVLETGVRQRDSLSADPSTSKKPP